MTDEVAFFTPEQARALWQFYLTYSQLNPAISKNQKQERQPVFATSPEVAVILDADLGVATDSKTGATSAAATVLRWNATSEEYEETGASVTVWNHSEHSEFLADTFGFYRVINGHKVFFGDCEPMASR